MSREEVRAFAKRIKKLYIEHDELNRIWKKFDSLRVYNEYDTLDEDDDEKDPRHLILMGLSGVGKSQVGKRYAKKYPGHILETDEERIPSFHIYFFRNFSRTTWRRDLTVPTGTPSISDISSNEHS